MNKIIFFLLLFSSQIYSQIETPASFKLGFKDGAGTSQVSGDTYRGFHKFGYVGGAYLKALLKNEWTGAIEAVFTQCGSRHNSDYTKGEFNSYFLQLNYIEVPVLLQYHIEEACIEFGPGCGFLLQTKEIISQNGVNVDGTRTFNKNDINLNIGVSYVFKSNFGFNLRYSNSILPIRKNLYGGSKLLNYGQLNSLLTLCLTYEFDIKRLSKD